MLNFPLQHSASGVCASGVWDAPTASLAQALSHPVVEHGYSLCCGGTFGGMVAVDPAPSLIVRSHVEGPPVSKGDGAT